MDIRFKPIQNSDLELILAWRNNPDIYKWTYLQRNPISWETHKEFWTNEVYRSNCRIIIYGSRRIGYLGGKIDSEGITEIFIFIGEPTLWGQGIGPECITKLLKSLKKDKVRARINTDNKSSIRAFSKCGFTFEKNNRPEEVIYSWTSP